MFRMCSEMWVQWPSHHVAQHVPIPVTRPKRSQFRRPSAQLVHLCALPRHYYYEHLLCELRGASDVGTLSKLRRAVHRKGASVQAASKIAAISRTTAAK